MRKNVMIMLLTVGVVCSAFATIVEFHFGSVSSAGINFLLTVFNARNLMKVLSSTNNEN